MSDESKERDLSIDTLNEKLSRHLGSLREILEKSKNLQSIVMLSPPEKASDVAKERESAPPLMESHELLASCDSITSQIFTILTNTLSRVRRPKK